MSTGDKELTTQNCPKCRSQLVRRYAYGYIVFLTDQEREEFETKFILGGCTVSSASPLFYCDSCDADYI
jgi:hypothetical protein